ncbi:hypothetical protein [Leifsonia xyli]|uniref:hypothetical protein n=1 Tax=Leifsonia xyli TaxID=1575 RepID=UPI003D6654A2
MTAVVVSAYRPLTHRVAHRLGRALTAWAERPLAREPFHAERIARIETARDSAARALPQLPR